MTLLVPKSVSLRSRLESRTQFSGLMSLKLANQAHTKRCVGCIMFTFKLNNHPSLPSVVKSNVLQSTLLLTSVVKSNVLHKATYHSL